jgi:steroid 5-alpha reductase family enzyme
MIGPLWISFIIIFFSGIPPLEKKWKEKYMSDPEFRNYWGSSWRLIPGIY